MKKVKITKDIDTWNVLTTKNGTQWNSVYYDKSFSYGMIIVEAFTKIGYKAIEDGGHLR